MSGEADVLMTVTEVAAFLNCSTTTVYNLLDAGELRGFRMAGGGTKARRRVYRKSIFELMERNAIVPTAKKKQRPLVPKPERPKGRPTKLSERLPIRF